MKKIFIVLVLVSLLLGGCSSHPEDPSPTNEEIIARAFIDACSSGDTVTSIGLLAEDCVFSQGLTEAQIVGKDKVADFLRISAEWHEKLSVNSPFKVKGEKVTFTARITSDDLQIMGVDSINADFEILVRDGKIASLKAMPDGKDLKRLAELSGVGIGVTFSVVKQGYEITGFAENSPAQEAGVKLGDVVIAVDKVSYSQMRPGETEFRIKGPVGKKVVLTIIRKGITGPIDIEVNRAAFKELLFGQHGTAGRYDVSAFSFHFPSGYYVQLGVDDSSQTIQSVSVTGPGISGSVSLVYGTPANEWWSQPNINLGATPPDLPLAYTFNIDDKSGATYVVQVSILSYVERFATNLSPKGDQVFTKRLVFSWTGIDMPDVTYEVQLSNDKGNRIWDSPPTTSTSVIYDGPALTPGTYQYFVSSMDSYVEEGI